MMDRVQKPSDFESNNILQLNKKKKVGLLPTTFMYNCTPSKKIVTLLVSVTAKSSFKVPLGSNR
jgi:hypothetical protein